MKKARPNEKASTGDKRKAVPTASKTSGKEKQAATAAKRKTATTRNVQHAVTESEESSGEDIPEPPPKRIRSSKQAPRSAKDLTQDQEDHEEDEDDTDDAASGEDDMSDDEREQDVNARDFFELEHLNIDGSPNEVDDVVRGHHRSSSRASAVSSAVGSEPPATDTDGILSNPEDEEDEQSDTAVVVKPRTRSHRQNTSDLDGIGPVIQKTARRTTRRARQLEYELPQVTQTSVPTQPAPTTTPWLERTNLAVTGRGRTFHAAMSDQGPDIRKLMDQAIKLGKLNMLVDHQYSPVSQELKQIAFAALASSAEDLGYTGQYDILDRLEHGDNDRYTKPITDYVGHRIGMERARLKTTQVATVLSAFGFGDTPSDPQEAAALVQLRNYIYPQDEDGNYDHSKPFEHPVIIKYIRSMFFGSTLYSGIISRNKHLFSSSIIQKPDELEGMFGSQLQLQLTAQDYLFWQAHQAQVPAHAYVRLPAKTSNPELFMLYFRTMLEAARKIFPARS
ncbi:hypothetical protein K435DRAFT_809781 [Dendrothele bispora CBS 962.96]|uniref:DUF6532 domain-containing protein n=1 Tax=Dendrothele bispora (strain CBS 962.96) TaxID=1314807 RepID=A0A4S8KXD9_DENBC|nr:hypothetical protein K435DRAFT_809781 [Dendrothele bispora CBS 962.96]